MSGIMLRKYSYETYKMSYVSHSLTKLNNYDFRRCLKLANVRPGNFSAVLLDHFSRRFQLQTQRRAMNRPLWHSDFE